MTSNLARGLYAATSTPITDDLSIDQDKFSQHCDWLLANGVRGICPFGTTGEGVSFSVAERTRSLEALVAYGIKPPQLVPATGVCAVDDAVALSKHAVELGCPALLVMPPFYIKRPPDDGIFAFYSRLIEQLNDSRSRILLYNIPQLTSVEISHDVVAKLYATYPTEVLGIKDSGGDFAKTLSYIAAFPDLAVLTGTDAHIVDCLRAGGAGTVTGMANINPAVLAGIVHDFKEPSAKLDCKLAGQLHRIVESFGGIAAMKSVIAAHRDDEAWARVLPPLVATPKDRAQDLVAVLKTAGHVWPREI